MDTIDLDAPCMWAEFTTETEGKEHKNTHRLLQMRRSIPHRKFNELISRAQSKLEDLDEAILHIDENGMS